MASNRRTVLLASPALLLGAATRGGPTTPERDDMTRLVEAFRTQYAVPGLSIAIGRDGDLVYNEAFGWADQDTKEHLTTDHFFRIASLSKPITATAILMLMEQGRLSLDDRVFGAGGILGNKFSPPPYRSGVDRITVDHLLTHTCGGWPNDADDPMFRNDLWSHGTLIERTIHDMPLGRPPGTGYAYSNFGYCVLGRVIEHLTGARYDSFVNQEVLRRCGISDMAIAGNTPGDRRPMEVRYYGQDFDRPYHPNVARMDANGGWIGRPIDLVNFALRVDGFPKPADILQPSTIAAMSTPSTVAPTYAKGWSVNARGNRWHSGSLPGSVSLLVRTFHGFCWAACANTRRPNSPMGRDLDRLLWAMSNQVAAWRT